MDAVHIHVICLLLSWVFLSATWHKLRRPDHFRDVLDGYRLLPFRAHAFHALIVGCAEAAIGIGLLVGQIRATAAVAGMTVLTAYALAIGINLLRGRSDMDCGCAGPSGHQPISWQLVARNIFLAALAVATLVTVPERTLGWLDRTTIIFAGLLAVVIYQASSILLENRLKLDAIRRGV